MLLRSLSVAILAQVDNFAETNERNPPSSAPRHIAPWHAQPAQSQKLELPRENTRQIIFHPGKTAARPAQDSAEAKERQKQNATEASEAEEGDQKRQAKHMTAREAFQKTPRATQGSGARGQGGREYLRAPGRATSELADA